MDELQLPRSDWEKLGTSRCSEEASVIMFWKKGKSGGEALVIFFFRLRFARLPNRLCFKKLINAVE